MRALIDADIVAFRCAATAEGLDVNIALARTNDLVDKIINDVGADNYTLYLTGRGNFRKELYPEYKAHRTKPPPQHLQACREYLQMMWQAVETSGCEADDALGVEQVSSISAEGDDPERPVELRTIICSIDKDLLQIPGRHFNFVKGVQQEVTLMRGLREFYSQMLIGDVSDNVKGIYGIGPKKAQAMLEGYEDEQGMFDAVRAAYNNDNQFLLTGKLLWIWRKENDIWNPSNLMGDTQLDLETLHESMPSTVGETIQSTEPI